MIRFRTILILLILGLGGYTLLARSFEDATPGYSAPAGFALEDRFISIEGLMDIRYSDLKRKRLLRRIKTEMLSLECEKRGLSLTRDELVEHVRVMFEAMRVDEETRAAMEQLRPGYWEVEDWSDDELNVYRVAVLSMLIAEDESQKNPPTPEEIEGNRQEFMELNPRMAPENVTEVVLRNDLLEERLRALSTEIRDRYKEKLVPTAHVPQAIIDEVEKELGYTSVFNLGYFWMLRLDGERATITLDE